MVLGYSIVKLKIFDCHSLKGKRKVVKSLINKISSKHNISIAETGLNDICHFAEIGFAVVGNNNQFINSIMDKILNLIYDNGFFEVINSDMEILHI